MRIESINVGVPEVIDVKGKQVATTIFKRPVTGRVAINALGVAGDHRVSPRSCGELDHAIYFYPHAHYEHWRTQLRREHLDAGQFGENITVSGVLEQDVRLGDVLRCGTAIVQVTQPRLPCAKLNARMGLRFAGMFLRSRRLGFYARVLTPGDAGAGDLVELMDSDPDSPTMDEFIRISQLDYWDAAGLERLLRARGLPAWWHEQLTDKLARARAATGWFGLRELEVVGRRSECYDTVSVWLGCPEQRPLAPFLPGQHLTLALRVGADESVVRRAYAITSVPHAMKAYRITVQLARSPAPSVPDGLVSRALVRELLVGDRVRAAAPTGSLTLREVDEHSAGLLFVCQDIGVASIIGCVREWSERLAAVPARLALEAESSSRCVFADDLRSFSRDAGLDVHVALRAPNTADRLGRDYHGRGALGPTKLTEMAPPPGGHVLIAGANRFVNAALAALGTADVSVRVQRYGG